MTDAPAPSLRHYRAGQEAFEAPASLHVMVAFFNFNRYRKPVENFHAFERHMRELGVTLHVGELVVGNSPFQVTDADNPRHVQLRTRSEFFQKENILNLVFRNAARLHPEAQKFAWIDTDVRFFNPQVVGDTLYALERFPVVQMWSYGADLDPKGHPLEFPNQGTNVARSFAWCWVNHVDFTRGYGGAVWHTGYAWAATRATLEALGGFYDRTIIGAADYHMAWAFIGRPERGIHGEASEGYKADAMAWCDRAARVVDGNLGVIDGLIHHAWHGRKINRRYVGRWEILIANGFDPARDLRYDVHGLLHLTDANPKLRRDIRDYLALRNDDDNTNG